MRHWFCRVGFVLAATLAITTARGSDLELVIDLSSGGALSLRSTTGAAHGLAGYGLISAGGFLADTGDETLGGQLSQLLFDVDNAGTDTVTMWTLGPGVPVPASPAELPLNLAWIGAGDPLADLTLEFGNSDPSLPLTAMAELVVIADVLLGDYDGTGTVGQSDLNLALLNWGTDTNLTGAPAGWVSQIPSGVIGQEELNDVLLNWGNTEEIVMKGVALPEPAGIIFVLLPWVVASLRPRSVRI